MFQVFDNNKPAEITGINFPKWHNSKFRTFTEAQVYARNWLKCGGDQNCACDDIEFTINVPYNYGTGGAPRGVLEIREIQ